MLDSITCSHCFFLFLTNDSIMKSILIILIPAGDLSPLPELQWILFSVLGSFLMTKMSFVTNSRDEVESREQYLQNRYYRK